MTTPMPFLLRHAQFTIAYLRHYGDFTHHITFILQVESFAGAAVTRTILILALSFYISFAFAYNDMLQEKKRSASAIYFDRWRRARYSRHSFPDRDVARARSAGIYPSRLSSREVQQGDAAPSLHDVACFLLTTFHAPPLAAHHAACCNISAKHTAPQLSMSAVVLRLARGHTTAAMLHRHSTSSCYEYASVRFFALSFASLAFAACSF